MIIIQNSNSQVGNNMVSYFGKKKFPETSIISEKDSLSDEDTPFLSTRNLRNIQPVSLDSFSQNDEAVKRSFLLKTYQSDSEQGELLYFLYSQ